MTEDEMEVFGQKLIAKLQQARSVSDSEHYDHHRWISERIKKEQARRRFYEDLRHSLIKNGLWGVILGLLAALVFAFKAWLAEQHK